MCLLIVCIAFSVFTLLVVTKVIQLTESPAAAVSKGFWILSVVGISALPLMTTENNKLIFSLVQPAFFLKVICNDFFTKLIKSSF